MFLISYCSREFSSVDKHNICEVCVRTLKKKKKTQCLFLKFIILNTLFINITVTSFSTPTIYPIKCCKVVLES